MPLQREQKQLTITPQYLSNLYEISRSCRLNIVGMLTAAHSSHLGCSFSIIDILVVLYHHFLDIDLIRKQSPDRDYFIVSKGHAAAGLYAALASVGLIPLEDCKSYHLDGSLLAGHPMRNAYPGIEASTGSLGHGLSMGVGLALAAKNDNKNNKIYVLVGDGECQEGSMWEAIWMAARFKLNNLTIIVDYNNLQGLDRSDDLTPGTLEEKFKSFHCNVLKTDGHDHELLIKTLASCGQTENPDVIIAKTIKGKGISWIEDKLEWHYKSLKGDQYKNAKQDLQ